jgi:exonuclease I
VEDEIFLPIEENIENLVQEKIQDYYFKVASAQIKESEDPNLPKMINYFYKGLPGEKDIEEITELRKYMKRQRASLTDIAKYVRIVPMVVQLLKSPFYRSELVSQFTKWRELRKEIIDKKLTIDEEEIEQLTGDSNTILNL